MTRKEMIKAAAIALFAGRGFQPAPTAGIAKQAGGSEGVILYHSQEIMLLARDIPLGFIDPGSPYRQTMLQGIGQLTALLGKAMVAKMFMAISAWGMGGVAAFAPFPRLQQGNHPPSDLELAGHPIFVADLVVSLFAGVLVGYLFYLCLGECLAKGAMHLFRRRR